MFLPNATTLVLALTLGGLLAQAPATTTALPENFTASAQVAGAAGTISATVKVRIDRYIVDYAEDAIRNGLKHGGYSGFLTALRAAPAPSLWPNSCSASGHGLTPTASGRDPTPAAALLPP